jgi:hypothetical protein
LHPTIVSIRAVNEIKPVKRILQGTIFEEIEGDGYHQEKD